MNHTCFKVIKQLSCFFKKSSVISFEKCNLPLLNAFHFQLIYLIITVCKIFMYGYVHTQTFISRIFFLRVQKSTKKAWPYSTPEAALQMHETRHRKSKSCLFEVPFDNLSGNNSPKYFSLCFKMYCFPPHLLSSVT